MNKRIRLNRRCCNLLLKWVLFPLPILAPTVSVLLGQSEVEQVAQILKYEIVTPQVSLFQLRQYLLTRVAKPPTPTSAQQWTADSKRIREQLLKVLFHGWPTDWINAAPKFEDLGIMHSGNGYRMRKLRYEVVPGFKAVGILYEPENLQGKIPAILNVNGHVGSPGKAVEYKQKRCINFAKRGMLALNLEWLGMGELGAKENSHWFGAHLDLVGTHELGLFYLQMRRGLDFLYDHASTDRDRIGMTGLSGGGWQTIVLSSLDERVKVSIPVAGFSSIAPRVEVREYGDIGDVEQSATDLFDGYDYSHLTALMAPRPTLLTYNAEDDCCFRGPVVKPLIYEAIRPIFKLYGKEDALEWHENADPGTHNYQLDNRQQSYRFFGKHFRVSGDSEEIPSDSEVKSYEELVVGLPEDNLTILGLARKLAGMLSRPPIPSGSARQSWAAGERSKLKTIVRHKPVRIKRAWVVGVTKNKGVESKSMLFEMDNGLSANAAWIKSVKSASNVPSTIILNDKGKQASAASVSDRVNRGEQVLALDLVFTGEAWTGNDAWTYMQLLHATGDRPLGLESAQLQEIARWLRQVAGAPSVRLEVAGIRNQVAALVASALEPSLFSAVTVREGAPSLTYLLDKPVEFKEAAELFCLDLFKEFDLDRLEALAEPTRVTNEKMLKITKET
jgi:dienelactone hydrolase